MANLTAIGVNKVVHIILGLPGESRDQMAESVRYAVDHGADGLKLQLLHVLRGTDLAATENQPMPIDQIVGVRCGNGENLAEFDALVQNL